MASFVTFLLLQGFLSSYSEPIQFHRKHYEHVPHELAKILRDQSVLMVGDSLMRYHYMSLVYNLRHRSLIHPDMTPNSVAELSWGGSYNTFFKGSTSLFAPYEFCDCHRPQALPLSQLRMFENRFYHDPVLNVSVSFFFFCGNHTLGHWSPGQDDSLRTPQPTESPYNWLFDIEDFLVEVVPRLSHVPKIFLLNAGIWPNKFGTDMDLIDRIANHSVANFDAFIWKTTNYLRNQTGGLNAGDYRWYSKSLEFPSLHFNNLTWTADLAPEHYWDNCHFNAPVYWKVNEDLLYILKSAGYPKS